MAIARYKNGNALGGSSDCGVVSFYILGGSHGSCMVSCPRTVVTIPPGILTSLSSASTTDRINYSSLLVFVLSLER